MASRRYYPNDFSLPYSYEPDGIYEMQHRLLLLLVIKIKQHKNGAKMDGHVYKFHMAKKKSNIFKWVEPSGCP
jgi:hypothetical protein